MTDAEYAEQVVRLAGEGSRVQAAIVDPSAASFILELRRRGLPVRGAENDVLEGIRRTSTLMADGRLLIAKESCPGTVEELTDYRWDPKATAIGVEQPLKQNDHGADALRYAVATLWPRLCENSSTYYGKSRFKLY